jgi:hypothetical protein
MIFISSGLFENNQPVFRTLVHVTQFYPVCAPRPVLYARFVYFSFEKIQGAEISRGSPSDRDIIRRVPAVTGRQYFNGTRNAFSIYI